MAYVRHNPQREAVRREGDRLPGQSVCHRRLRRHQPTEIGGVFHAGRDKAGVASGARHEPTPLKLCRHNFGGENFCVR